MNKSAVDKSGSYLHQRWYPSVQTSKYTYIQRVASQRDTVMSVVECVRSFFRANRERILDGGPRVELKGR
jgi:hypothetical protein